MKKIFIIYSVVILAFFSFIYGCSEVKDNLITAQKTGVHPEGWVSPASVNFHGHFIENDNWQMNSCKPCHGGDFSGGTSQNSCFTCHENGPTSCTLCHGSSTGVNPPKSLHGNMLNTQQGVGAHVKHLITDSLQRYSKPVECEECHTPVMSFDDTNHIRKDNITAASVMFGPLAKKVTTVTPNPQWDRTTQTCSNVYCHGAFTNGNLNSAPSFIDPSSAHCGTCHGNPTTGNPLPGGTHPDFFPNITDCYRCHVGVMKPDGTFRNRNRHINGIIDVGAN